MRFTTRLKPTAHHIDMTPIVDVIFLLLIFFIVTSDTLPLKSLPVQAPALPLNSLPLTAQLVVVVDAQEVLYIGSKKAIVELSALTSELKREVLRYQKLHTNTTPTLVLQIDRHVSYDTFLQVFHAAQQVGTAIRLAYNSSDEEVLDAAPLR